MSSTPRRVRIGKVVGFHGLKGDIKLRPASDPPDWLDTLENAVFCWGETRERPVRITSARLATPDGPIVLLRLEGVPDRTAAEAYAGAELYATPEDLPPPAEGEIRVDDLIGLTVIDRESGRPVARVRDFLTSGGGDYLELQNPATGKTLLVPYQAVFFPTENLADGTLTVDNLGGLLADLD